MNATIGDDYRLSWDDWLQLPRDEPGYEIIDGELYVNPAASIVHHRINRRLGARLAGWSERAGLGEAFITAINVKLADDTIVEPDLCVVLADRRHLIRSIALHGAPNFVVEILSPGGAARDMVLKRNAYSQFGADEYWIIDPKQQRIVMLSRGHDGLEERGVVSCGDVAESSVLDGFSIRVDEVFSD